MKILEDSEDREDSILRPCIAIFDKRRMAKYMYGMVSASSTGTGLRCLTHASFSGSVFLARIVAITLGAARLAE